ncbi:MAG: PAS domain S-box protein [Thermoleophilia bacterium]|nr:PAS domain S-box protein [Thermoleophilia bacterium]
MTYQRQATPQGPPSATIGIALYDPVDQHLLEDYLAGLGYTVTALDKDTDLGKADLVILDTRAARVLGPQILEYKRKLSTFLPALVALGRHDPVEPWLDAGFDYCLRLPFNKALLRTIVALLLRQKEQSERLARATEAKYEAVFEATGTATLLVEPDGTISLGNQECLRVTGYTPAELMGTKWTRYVAPESLETLLDLASTYYQERSSASLPAEPRRYNVHFVRKDGELRQAAVTVGFIQETGQLVVSILDVTEEHQAVAAVKASELFFKRLFEGHSAAKLLIDPSTGQILDANEAAARLYGWSRDELRRMTIDQINAAPPDQIQEARKRVLAGEQSRFEFTHRRADGSQIDVEVFSAGISVPGRDPVIYAIVHDITDRKAAERERAELQSRIAQLEKMEAIGQLAGGIAHDFNNLLTTILGYCDLILADENRCPAPVREDVTEIKTAAERGASLTRQILAFSRRQTLRPELTSLNAVVQQMESFLRRTLGETIELLVVLASDLAPVEVDVHQFERVLLNLALNARDAMPAGGRLVIETTNVELSEAYCRFHPGAKPGPHVMLSVSDTGVGMDAQTMSHIFEPFFTTKPPGQGSGLGLSTVYGIVRQSGGVIFVYSEVGRGTTFKIYLPAAGAPDNTASASSAEKPSSTAASSGAASSGAASSGAAAPGIAPPPVGATILPLAAGAPAADGPLQATALGGHESILLVEDDPNLRELAARVLTELGYKVLAVGTGAEAVAAARATVPPPDLVLTDIILPGGMLGNELVQALASFCPQARVIYMSGYTRNAIVHGGRLDPGTNFLEKPFTPQTLAETVRRVLDQQPPMLH